MAVGSGQGSLFSEPEVLSVEELNRRVRDLLKVHLGTVWVEGELSGIKYYRTGGWSRVYGTLKDASAEVRIVIWEDTLAGVPFQLEDGMLVTVEAEVSLYPQRGQYQLVIRQVRPSGVGALELAFQQLKERLGKEGLFDEARKRPLPAFPFRVGVVTSLQAAALKDFLQVTSRRNPALRILIAPARVQGEGAAAEIVAAIQRLGGVSGLDLIVLTRGGGSLEDLWPFNEEAVARAIHACPLPVVSGVGHEVDWTIADLVADRRAPTPSAAAELVAWPAAEWRLQLAEDPRRMARALTARVRTMSEQVRWFTRAHGFQVIRERIREGMQRSDEALRRLPVSLTHRLERAGMRQREARRALRASGPRGVDGRHDRLDDLMRTMNALGPRAVLSRGYAIARRPDGTVLRDTAEVSEGEGVTVYLHRGAIDARVEGTREGLERLGDPGDDSQGGDETA